MCQGNKKCTACSIGAKKVKMARSKKMNLKEGLAPVGYGMAGAFSSRIISAKKPEALDNRLFNGLKILASLALVSNKDKRVKAFGVGLGIDSSVQLITPIIAEKFPELPIGIAGQSQLSHYSSYAPGSVKVRSNASADNVSIIG